jgi:hypothetical protein
MKKIIAAAILSASLVNTAAAGWSEDMRDRFAVPDFIAEVEKARNSAPVCRVTLTNEATGKTSPAQNFTPSGDVYDKGTTRTYHEEDATGSTTVQIDTRTGKGFLSMMDESSVIATGPVTCKNI